MKKSQNATELAARISEAANKPAGASSVLPTLVAPSIPNVAITPKTAPPVTRSKAKAANEKEADTKPITLRPKTALLNKYVLKASERTREEGRVVSAQQIMLETLERSDA